MAPGTDSSERQRRRLQEGAGFNPLHAQAFIWLSRAFNAAITAQAVQLRPLGLSPSGFNVLLALHDTPGQLMEPCEPPSGSW